MEAKILLEDGTIITGKAFGVEGTVFGEIVFNTGMTGYQEILTDPSYSGQIVVMTYPLIGNYGISDDDIESESLQVKGLVVKEFSKFAYNSKSVNTINEYLIDNNILGVSDVDTRMITKKIRDKGAMNCVITTGEITEELLENLKKFSFPEDIVSKVSRKDIKVINGINKKIGLIDFGVKRGIVNQLKALGCEIYIMPWDISADEVLKLDFDALFLSNGPGDPKDLTIVIENVKKLIGKLPIYGICLGHQILALALGGETYKLKFGHRGSNHPVIDLRTNKVIISSQNHGYAMEYNYPDIIEITHKNVNDETIEGFICSEYNIRAVQFHPEAGPGPEDANYIFKEWIDILGKEDLYA